MANQNTSGGRSICLTPERVAVLSLHDCADQLDRCTTEPDRLAMAAKALHLALQAALTAALAGPANVGAHSPKLRAEYLVFLDGLKSGKVEAPVSDKVMGFNDLLSKAKSEPLPWTSAPVTVSAADQLLLDRLTFVRHAVEHPKQSFHGIGSAFVAEALPVAARLITDLLQSVAHHFEPEELAGSMATASRISDLSAAMMM